MPWQVWVLWALFLVRAGFYCTMLPLWEGWDEYAHFGWLQHWNDHGTLPNFEDPVSREIDESMRLAPLPSELRWLGPPYLIHSQWWALPETERVDRAHALASLPPAFAHQPASRTFVFYEAQQPPLYYWALSLPLRLAPRWPLKSRVLLLRLLSAAMASAAIPLAWLATQYMVGRRLALLCAALVAVAPGFALDVSRVANDSLAIALASLLFWLLARDKPAWFAAGLTLGAGLLTKAFLLLIVPAMMPIWWRRKRDLALALSVAFAIAGWWYIRNVMLGHSLSGWLLHGDSAKLFAAAFRINWLSTTDVIAKSMIWFGGWSFLTLKSWMYRVLESIALAGLVLALAKWKKSLQSPAILSGVYLLGMAYGVLTYAVTQNVPNLPGWYLWPIASMFAAILVAGLERLSTLMIAALAAIDLYGAIALLTPYYAGLAPRNRAAGSQFFAALTRLGIPVWLALAWIAATLGIVIVVAMADYEREKHKWT